jgi:hypothetical protein
MHREFETLREELERVLGGLDAQQTQLRPGGDAARWSIQQTVTHLLLTYAATERAIEARIAKGSGTRARPTILQRVGQLLIIRAGLFPPGREAPETVTPAPEEMPLPSGVLIERVGAALESMDMRIKEGERVFGTKRQAVRHAVLGPLTFGQWTRFHLIHGHHHVKLIARTRSEFGV